VYDAQGNSHVLALNFVKLSTNTWGVELTAVPASDILSTSSITGDGQIANGTISFNGNGADPQVTGSIASPITVVWSNGAAQSSISVGLGQQAGATVGLSQAAGAFNVSTANQNGSPTGQLTGVSINASGFVIATFSNGQTQEEFQIPLANVSNPNGLNPVSGDAYSQTLASGIPNLQFAGTSGVGTFSPSSLEQSNVDLSTQLTDLIVAQQAYGANSKVLTIADQLLQELDQIIQ
jgi:flagellar hook protein FlgE